MSVEHKCENCINSNCECNCKTLDECFEVDRFCPSEELVRQDERNIVIAEIIEDFTNPNYDIAITKEDGSTYRVCVKYLYTHTGIKENKIIISN